MLSARPTFVNRITAQSMPTGLVLLEDENSYPGRGLYSAFVSFGRLLAPVLLLSYSQYTSRRIHHA